MKKLLLGLGLSLVAFGMTGCDDGQDWGRICKNFSGDLELEKQGLTEDQLSEITDLYVDACVDVNSNMPKCGDEYYDYMKCIYIDNPMEYWDEQDNEEDKCYENYTDQAEIDACVDKLYQACRSVDEKLSKCTLEHEDELDAYMESASKNAYKKVQEKLVEWGIPVDSGSLD